MNCLSHRSRFARLPVLSGMPPQRTKYARLHELVSLGLNNSEVVKVLGKLRAQPDLLDQPVSRSQLERASKSLYKNVGHEILLPSIGRAAPFVWEVGDLPKVLKHFTHVSVEFKDMLADLHARHPSSPGRPWKIIFYFDEATPGAVLDLNNSRKLWCFYISFRELGPSRLCMEGAWIPIAVLRTTECYNIKGGFSYCARVLLRHILLGPGNMRTDGVLLPISPPDGAALVFATFGNILCDYAACNAFWNSKTASGLKPCFSCGNCAALDDDGHCSLAAHDPTGRTIDTRCPDISRFERLGSFERFVHADTLTQLHAEVTGGTIRPQDFALAEQMYGLNFNPDGVLWDHELRSLVGPGEVNRFDPTHCLWSNGICAKEFGLLFSAIQSRTTFEDIRAFMQADWRMPNCNARRQKLRSCLSDARARHFHSTKEFRPSAAECMDLLPILRYFVESQPPLRAQWPLETESFIALCQANELSIRAKQGEALADALDAAWQTHANRFTAAYDALDHLPKFHFTRHLPEQVRLDGWAIDTFTCERHNSMVLEAAGPIDKTSCFERSVLARSLILHASKLTALRRDGLVQPMHAENGDYWFSKRVIWNGATIAQDDVLFTEGLAFLVAAALQVGDKLGLFAHPLSREEEALRYVDVYFV